MQLLLQRQLLLFACITMFCLVYVCPAGSKLPQHQGAAGPNMPNCSQHDQGCAWAGHAVGLLAVVLLMYCQTMLFHNGSPNAEGACARPAAA